MHTFSTWHRHALAVEQAMVECEVRPSAQLLLNLLSAYGHSGDIVRVFSVLHNMKTRQLPLSKEVYLEVARALSNATAATPALSSRAGRGAS